MGRVGRFRDGTVATVSPVTNSWLVVGGGCCWGVEGRWRDCVMRARAPFKVRESVTARKTRRGRRRGAAPMATFEGAKESPGNFKGTRTCYTKPLFLRSAGNSLARLRQALAPSTITRVGFDRSISNGGSNGQAVSRGHRSSVSKASVEITSSPPSLLLRGMTSLVGMVREFWRERTT